MNQGQWGLILDIIGVICLFIAASNDAFDINILKILQNATRDTVKENNVKGLRRKEEYKPDEKVILLAKIYTILSYVGLCLIILGFVLQLIQSFDK